MKAAEEVKETPEALAVGAGTAAVLQLGEEPKPPLEVSMPAALLSGAETAFDLPFRASALCKGPSWKNFCERTSPCHTFSKKTVATLDVFARISMLDRSTWASA